jgi:hypothetical protein
LYCGASALAGVKLVKQSYDIMPDMIKAGGEALHQASILSGAGFPAAQGWYSTIAAPHMLDEARLSAWLTAPEPASARERHRAVHATLRKCDRLPWLASYWPARE